MVIANPIYDVVFKRMMENEKVAKFFIGTLLDEIIIDLNVKPHEFTYTNEGAGIALFRLDFIATIKTEGGEFKKILIEIQKARNHVDLMRFRNYLAEQYKKVDILNNEKIVLPITTVFILGFNLAEIESPCLKVERSYIDLINKAFIKNKSEFIEKLSHDSYIVQVDRITNKYGSKLEKLLSIFEQNNFTDENKITKTFNHIADIEEIKLATDILHFAGTDPEERKKIEIEQEGWRSLNAMFEDKEKEFMKTLNEKDKKIEEKDKKIEEKDKILEENTRQIQENEKLISELMNRLNMGK